MPTIERAPLQHCLEITAGTIAVRTQAGPRLPLQQVPEPSGTHLPGTRLRKDRVRAVECSRSGFPSSSEPHVLVDGDDQALADDPPVPAEWSRRSRARMLKRIASIDWTEAEGVPELMTLTYPRRWPRNIYRVKRDLRRFHRRWERRWGYSPPAIWKLEFQLRGAPHIHLFAYRPAVPWREFLLWARSAWHEVTHQVDRSIPSPLEGPEDASSRAHREQGVRLDRSFVGKTSNPARIAHYFWRHASKTKDKTYQNRAPADCENVGRWWGVWSGTTSKGRRVCRPKVEEVSLTTSEFIAARRLVTSLRRSRAHRKVKGYGRLQGLWSLSADPQRFAGQLLGAIRDEGPAPSRMPAPVEVVRC